MGNKRFISIYRQSKPSGFTLIELLVSLAVIGILATLLASAVSKSKNAAANIKCVSNLRQLGIAAQMYWEENEGRFFRYGPVAKDNGKIYWFGWLSDGIEGERDFDPTQAALYPYLSGRGVELCPSLNYAMKKFKLKARGASYGYGYNLCLSTPLNQPRTPVSKVTMPHKICLLADSAQVNTFQPPASPKNPMLEEFYYLSTNKFEATVHFRHKGRANAVFCDGHVSPESPDPASLDLRIEGEIIGRLRPEALAIPK
ncbi:MAG: prepilin-type N-terminal cleavage/methylation domain-containing protein [Verrucomicrobiia bacterium]|jgi:prepilin-type N-terminal cleavage/methylation domain-containing protein/prepilin-type processing-associated H-X9-DG protein